MTMFDMTPFFSTTIGFDRMAKLLGEVQNRAESANSYPPYDILSEGEDRYRITMSVAGFTLDDLSIETRDNRLTVSGQKDKKGSEGEYLYRGIAERNFKTEFQLADHVEVSGANLSNGLLTIDLVREVPEALKPKQIEIRTTAPKSLMGKAKQLLSDKSTEKAKAA